MAVFGGTGSPHFRRVPKDVRRLAKGMLKRRASHHRANVLLQQAALMEHGVSRSEGRNGALPELSEDGDPAQRLRLGTETRGNLKRLLASRSLREQQQLVRVIRADIERRIRRHVARVRAAMKIREKARTVARWSWGKTRAGVSWTVTRARQGRSRVRSGPGFGRTVRTVGSRTPGVRQTPATPARARKPREAAPTRARKTPASRG